MNAAAGPIGPTGRVNVLERLRREIYEGVREPGSKVVQTDVAREYGVSATPVREAMRDLVNEGLLTAEPHRAARVRALDPAEAVDINELRLVLEPYAASIAALHISTAEIDELVRLNESMTDATGGDWVELNHRFHMVIIEATRNPTLVAMLTNLRLVSRFYFSAALRADGGDYGKRNRQHDELIDQLRRRNTDGAAATTRGHFSSSDELRRRLTQG